MLVLAQQCDWGLELCWDLDGNTVAVMEEQFPETGTCSQNEHAPKPGDKFPLWQSSLSLFIGKLIRFGIQSYFRHN